MDNILVDKFKRCYEISDKVVSKYNELYSVICEYYLEDSVCYESYVLDVWELILEEYKIYNSLTLNDINAIFMCIEENKWDESITGLRIKSKIEDLKKVYTNISIDKNILEIDIVPDCLVFNMFSSLISFIDIEMMKRVKLTLDNLVTDNYNDLSFVNSMYKEFNEIMIFQAFYNNLTEVIYFNSNMDLDMISKIDTDNLIEFINEMLTLDYDYSFSPVDDFLIELSKITIDRLVNEKIDNNPSNILNYLTIITRLDVIFDFLNKEFLIVLLNYCNDIKNDNEFGINNIIGIIRKRMK